MSVTNPAAPVGRSILYKTYKKLKDCLARHVLAEGLDGAAVTYVENIPGPACSESRIDRLFHSSDGKVSGVIRLHRTGPRRAANRSL